MNIFKEWVSIVLLYFNVFVVRCVSYLITFRRTTLVLLIHYIQCTQLLCLHCILHVPTSKTFLIKHVSLCKLPYRVSMKAFIFHRCNVIFETVYYNKLICFYFNHIDPRNVNTNQFYVHDWIPSNIIPDKCWWNYWSVL